MNGKRNINDQKFRKMAQKIQNMLDKIDLRPMGDHLDMYQHIYIDWNLDTDRFTQVAREKSGHMELPCDGKRSSD